MQNSGRYPKLWQGIVFFGAVILAMILVAAPVQMELGLAGVAITEIMLLVMAVGAAILSKCRLSDVFPIVLTPPKKMLGIFMMYGGLYLAVIAGTTVMAQFMPSLNDVSVNIASIGTQLSPAAAIVIMAILPAICEESVFRGYILASFKSMPNLKIAGFSWKFITVILVGTMFGIFHLDPTRYLMTAILGAFFTYVAIESGSMFPSMLLHMINNLISVVAMYSLVNSVSASSKLEIEQYILYPTMQLIASCMCYAGAAILLYFFGWKIFKAVKVKRAFTVSAVVLSLVLMVGGYVMTLISVAESI